MIPVMEIHFSTARSLMSFVLGSGERMPSHNTNHPLVRLLTMSSFVTKVLRRIQKGAFVIIASKGCYECDMKV